MNQSAKRNLCPFVIDGIRQFVLERHPICLHESNSDSMDANADSDVDVGLEVDVDMCEDI